MTIGSVLTPLTVGDPGEQWVPGGSIVGSLLGMRPCDSCGETVDSRWKFCLDCGASVVASPIASALVTARVPALAIPGAIRPEGAVGGHVAHRRLRIDWQLTVGVVLAAAGAALIVFFVVAVVFPRG
jgi:hypothetical protein